jgi:hypothetical protein
MTFHQKWPSPTKITVKNLEMAQKIKFYSLNTGSASKQREDHARTPMKIHRV